MKLVEGMGLDWDYLRAGAEKAKKALGSAFKATDHPTNEDEVRGFVEKHYEVAAMRYQGFYMTLMQAALWRYGQHSVQINPHTWLFETIPVDMRIPRPTINLIGDKVESVVGEILRAMPTGMVLPVDNTPLNRRGAQIGDAYLKVKDEEDEIQELDRMVAECAAMWGDAYVEVVVDMTNPRRIEMPMFSEVDMGDGPMALPMTDADGNPVTQMLPLADESCNLITPLQMFSNQTAKGVRTARKLHSHCYNELDWGRDTWPKQADKMKGAAPTNQASQFQMRFQNLMLYDASRIGGLAAPVPASDFGNNDDAILVHVVRLQPDEYYEKGRYFIVAGSAPTVAGPLPFGKYMIVHYRYSPVPNSMLSYGMVKDMVEVNRWIEQMAHQTGMIRRTMGVPFILAPERAGGDFAQQVLPMRYGGIYTYRRQGDLKPEIVHPRGTMDSGTKAEMDLWLNEFFERASIRRTLQGDRPPGTYSGAMLQSLISQASGKFLFKAGGYAKFKERLNCLRLEAIAKAPASQFPRQISYPGHANRRLWMAFAASDMGDNVTYKMESVAASATDDAAQTEKLFKAFEIGLANPMDPKAQLAGLRRLGLQDLISELNPHIGRALDENARIQAGDEIQIGPYENDAIHLEVHTDWINSPEFTLIPVEAQLATIQHAQMHEQRIAIRMAEAEARGQIPSHQPSIGGAPMLPPAAMPPAARPGNGIPGTPQNPPQQQEVPQMAEAG